jgi:hypothetical protein
MLAVNPMHAVRRTNITHAFIFLRMGAVAGGFIRDTTPHAKAYTAFGIGLNIHQVANDELVSPITDPQELNEVLGYRRP